MSGWKSAGELYEITKEVEDRERLFSMYGLSLFSQRAFFHQTFTLSSRWADVIKLTEHAQDCAASLEKAGTAFDEPTKHFVFFQLFFHQDLFIDHVSTNAGAVLDLLVEMHEAGTVQWPYVYGNTLYHKFNDAPHATKTDHLEGEQTAALLDGTPQGVFQIGSLVSGPLGFIKGEEERILPPTLSTPLWHCSDPGCKARHLVKFRQFNTQLQAAYNASKRHILDAFGPPSEWHKPLLYIHHIEKWPNGRPFFDLPAIIGDCILESERTTLLARAVRSEHNSLLLKAVRDSGKQVSSLDEVAQSLTPEEQHQLLLLLPDTSIIRFLDELIAAQDILIPPSESRTAKSYVPDRHRGTPSRVTSLGIRSRAHPPVIELLGAIWSTYSAKNQLDDLRWRLREHEGSTPRHSTLGYIRSAGPRRAVRDLILPSRAITTAVFEQSGFTMLPDEDEDQMIDRLLWKFGFNLPRYEDTHQLLRNRIDEFESCVLQLTGDLSEGDKARVRSIGVNLFVSVEGFLEELVAYNVWLFSSDHFTGSNFRFTSEAAHRAVVDTLGPKATSGSVSFGWSTEGENTLGALLAYFQAYRTWLKERPDSDHTALRRSEDDYPHYAEDTVLEFPFQHTQLWADIPAEVLAIYIDVIDQVSAQLSQAELPLIRNGLDHKRPAGAFPSPDRMLVCVSRLRQVAELIDRHRLIPKLYWGTKSESDSNGNVCDTFQDYRGTSVALWEPPMVLAGPPKSFGRPYLIAPLDLMNLPNSMLIFSVISGSPYSEYWKNYPRRRFIPPREDTSEHDMKANYDDEQDAEGDAVNRAP